MRNYKNIKAFQLADDLVLEVYKVTKKLPNEETYGLITQLRRAAVSIPTNIAEGSSRQHKKDYLNFLFISRGSLAEVECLLGLAGRLGYIGKENFENLEEKKQLTAKTLYGLIESVKGEV